MAGRANGFSAKERAGVVRSTVRSYREWQRRFAALGNLPVWYARFDDDWVDHVIQEVSARARERWTRSVAKACTRDSLQAFDKLTHVVDGRVRIAPDAQLERRRSRSTCFRTSNATRWRSGSAG